MFKTQGVRDQLSKISPFDQMFQFYRLVEPMSHKIYELRDGKPEPADLPLCYEIWHRDLPCINCVSARTCREHSVLYKMEFLDGTVYSIVSVPVSFGGVNYSLELINDVSKSMMMSEGPRKGHIEIIELIKKLNELSVTDEFTSLYNRHFIKNKLEYLANPDEKSKIQPFSYAFMDIDDMRLINCDDGHATGDNVIHSIAGLLKRSERLYKSTFAGRMGDDEFGIVFDGYEFEEAKHITADIADEINTMTFTSAKVPGIIRIHVSSAVAQYEQDGCSVFMDRVEQAMLAEKKAYKAKKA